MNLFVCPPVCLSVNLSICPPVCLSVNLSICESVYLSECLLDVTEAFSTTYNLSPQVDSYYITMATKPATWLSLLHKIPVTHSSLADAIYIVDLHPVQWDLHGFTGDVVLDCL